MCVALDTPLVHMTRQDIYLTGIVSSAAMKTKVTYNYLLGKGGYVFGSIG